MAMVTRIPYVQGAMRHTHNNALNAQSVK